MRICQVHNLHNKFQIKKQDLTVYRGICPKGEYGFATDPGDFGRGIYYTTNKSRAKAIGGKNIQQSKLTFTNPLILEESEAYKLADIYKTVDEIDMVKRIANAERLTKDMLKQRHDGLFSIRRNKFGKIVEIEIVDYRLYIEVEQIGFTPFFPPGMKG